MPVVEIINWQDGQETNHPLILLRGVINKEEHENQEYKVICEAFPFGIEQKGDHFKLLYPLQEGQNTISLKITNESNIQYFKIQITYIPFQQELKYKVKFFYVTAQDQPDKLYDGYNYELERKKNSKRPYHQCYSNLSSTELAIRKIGIAARLVQTAFHELLTKHHLETIISTPIPNGITFNCESSPTHFGGRKLNFSL